MKTLAIIPARYASTRLPGKPLAKIAGNPMIRHVYEKAAEAVQNVLVATDDERIKKAVQDFDGQVVMTSSEHQSGTDRCLEAYQIWEKKIGETADVILNVQGDEPLLNPIDLKNLAHSFEGENTEMATLAVKISDIENENRVFVIRDENENALYFSRTPIPHLRDIPKSQWIENQTFLQHLGIYAFRPEALKTFASMKPSRLEKAEKLEQLRWLEAGRKIKVLLTENHPISVDTPEDLEKVRAIFSQK